MHDAPKIDVQRPLPVADRLLPERCWRAAYPHTTGRDARVVAEDVHRAVLVDRLLRELFDGLGAADIGDHADRIEFLLFELQHGGVESRLLDVGQHDLHAFARETLCEGAPHPACRTGHDRDTAIELSHCTPPLRRRHALHRSRARPE